MDAVTITASGQPFRVSKAQIKKYSRYFEQRFGVDSNSEKAVDLPGISANAFSVLLVYFSKAELNVVDLSLQALLAVQEAACTLGVTSFPQDLERALKASWSKMSDISAVFALASRIGMHTAMVRTVVGEVLSLLLGSKEPGGGSLRESSLTYESLIFAARLDTFWESLSDRCKYTFTYESFYEAVVGWIVKHDAREEDLVALVDSLKIHTVSFKFLNDCVANSTGTADMKEKLKFVLQRKQEAIGKRVCDHLQQLRISWYDASQGNVLLHALNVEKFGWDVLQQFTRAPLDTVRCAASDNYVYALGDQTLTSVRVEGGFPVFEKYPERLEINYCLAYASSLYCFAWNRRDHVLYEFHSERRKFLSHGTVPVDSNLAATALDNKLFVLGEVLHSSVKSNKLKVFRYHLKGEVFSWVAILNKTWCQPELTTDLEVREAPSTCRSHLVIADQTMYAFVQEFSSSLKSELYSFAFNHGSNNSSEVEPCKLDLPALMDRHAALVGLHSKPQGIVMLFRSSFKGEYALALLDLRKDEIQQLGFLPHFPQAHLMSAECVWLRPAYDTVPKTCEEGQNLQATDAASQDTLVREENDDPAQTSAPVQYKSPRKEDLANSRYSQKPSPFDPPDGRPVSRRSSLTSGFSFSSKASRRSKRGSKRSIASRAVSVVTSLVR